MKVKISREISVGIVFLVALIILGYYTIIMSSRFIEPDNSYPITVIFPNVEGLAIANKVKVNGVISGKVEDITLMDHHVKVKLRMYNRFTLYENFVIRIRNEALLGKKFISIFPGTPVDNDALEQGVVITRENLPGKYEDIVTSLSELIEENRDNIYVSINNIRQITDKINRGNGTLAKLINNGEVHDQAGSLVKELRESIEDAREQAPITSFIRAALTAF